MQRSKALNLDLGLKYDCIAWGHGSGWGKDNRRRPVGNTKKNNAKAGSATKVRSVLQNKTMGGSVTDYACTDNNVGPIAKEGPGKLGGKPTTSAS